MFSYQDYRSPHQPVSLRVHLPTLLLWLHAAAARPIIDWASDLFCLAALQPAVRALLFLLFLLKIFLNCTLAVTLHFLMLKFSQVNCKIEKRNRFFCYASWQAHFWKV